MNGEGSEKRRKPEKAGRTIKHFSDLDVYQNALTTGLRIYELTKCFPAEEDTR